MSIPSSITGEQYDALVAKIVDAVPDIVRRDDRCLNCQPIPKEDCPNRCFLYTFLRPIRLADVLLAIQEHAEDSWCYCVDSEGNINNGHTNTQIRNWNLRQDSLDRQSPECIAFLHSLLV